MEELPAPAGTADATLIDPTPTGAQATAPPSGDPSPSSPSPRTDEAPEAPEALEAPAPVDPESWLKEQLKADPEAFHKRLAADDGYNRVYQRHLSAGVHTETERRVADLQAQHEHEQYLTEFDTRFRSLSPEQREALRSNDTVARQWSRHNLGQELGAYDILRTDAEVLNWKQTRSTAPVRDRIATEERTAITTGLKTLLGADPDWKSVAGDFEKLEAAGIAEAESTGNHPVASIFKQFLDRRAVDIEARIRRELAPEIAAKVEDGVAARTEGLPDPVLVGAGTTPNGRSFRSLAEAEAAHAKQEINNDEYRRYLRTHAN